MVVSPPDTSNCSQLWRPRQPEFHTTTARDSIEPSYKPGIKLDDLALALADFAIEAIRKALPAFGKQIKGFDLHDAVLAGIEPRTSSSLHIPSAQICRASTCSGFTHQLRRYRLCRLLLN